MEKLLIFVFATVLLSSCVSNMGGQDRYWIVDKIYGSDVRGSKNITYTVKSQDINGFVYDRFIFEDVQGKFQVGDTVKLVLR